MSPFDVGLSTQGEAPFSAGIIDSASGEKNSSDKFLLTFGISQFKNFDPKHSHEQYDLGVYCVCVCVCVEGRGTTAGSHFLHIFEHFSCAQIFSCLHNGNNKFHFIRICFVHEFTCFK